jgi:Peptidase M50B-like
MKKADPVELRTLAVALLASLLLWNLPFGGVLLYPFKLLATWLHELSHGLAMIVTGTGFDRVVIYRDTSGLAYAESGAGPFAAAIIAAAGYMGTPLWGATLLVVTPAARSARIAMLVLGALLGVSALTVVASPSGDDFGLWAIGAIGVTFAACALALPGRWRVAVAHFVAAQACVNALLDIRVLLRPSQVVNGQEAGLSDAHTMAAATFGTTAMWAVWFWAVVWLVWSLAILYVALRVSGSQALARVAPFARPTASLPSESDRDGHRRSPATAPDETDPSAPADTAGS